MSDKEMTKFLIWEKERIFKNFIKSHAHGVDNEYIKGNLTEEEKTIIRNAMRERIDNANDR